jgi:hypothetical protein
MKKIFAVFVLIFSVFLLFAENEPTSGNNNFTSPKQEKSSSLPNDQQTYSRPYLGWGIPAIFIGGLGIAGMIGFSVAAASCYDDFDHMAEWIGFSYAAAFSGLLGTGLIVSGAIFTTIKKPQEPKSVSVNNLSVSPIKNGVYASAGFNF